MLKSQAKGSSMKTPSNAMTTMIAQSIAARENFGCVVTAAPRRERP